MGEDVLLHWVRLVTIRIHLGTIWIRLGTIGHDLDMFGDDWRRYFTIVKIVTVC